MHFRERFLACITELKVTDKQFGDDVVQIIHIPEKISPVRCRLRENIATKLDVSAICATCDRKTTNLTLNLTLRTNEDPKALHVSVMPVTPLLVLAGVNSNPPCFLQSTRLAGLCRNRKRTNHGILFAYHATIERLSDGCSNASCAIVS